jgi:hypothetical protein
MREAWAAGTARATMARRTNDARRGRHMGRDLLDVSMGGTGKRSLTA